MKRVYDVDQYLGRGSKVQIVWDASPYGMGAFVTVDGVVLEFFAIPIGDDDQAILGTKSGISDGQQVWECLGGLIAMRTWSRLWKKHRAQLCLKGDNISALVLFSQLKTHSKQLGMIAKEFALDLGEALSD